ncbi:MAG TPA: kelch repeat-containing protein [Sedimentisphaerales bacterium]|nr:kelch repeat-containing protein [Sedimentisphaerales bacterium]
MSMLGHERLTAALVGLICMFAVTVDAAMWVSGPNSVSQPGVYGTKGEPDAGNIPGARYGSISWIDGSGNFWLFGGSGLDGSGDEGRLNDLWRFEPSSGLWTWVSGSDGAYQFGVYGTKGVPDANNAPGARDLSISWIDGGGNFWLFGGYGLDASGSAGRLNDLWRFEPSSGFWTWVSGPNTINQFGVYVSKGVPDANNMPGARRIGISWIDVSGDLWLFGGDGFDGSGGSGPLNDLWKFDGVNWTWVSGSNVTSRPGVYGDKGEPNSMNVPGSRYGGVCWMDYSGNLCLFGGEGFDAGGSFGWLNDLWQFDGTNWTWVSGSDTVYQFGFYGTKGVPNRRNAPGSRKNGICWIDSVGDLWLFGGYGLGVSSQGRLSDLWRFEPSTSFWTWVSGSNLVNQPGVYGSKGVPNADNVPGARDLCISWIDSGGNLWLFGGNGLDGTGSFGSLNDLWQFECEKPAGDLNGDCKVDFTDFGIMASHWLEKGRRN